MKDSFQFLARPMEWTERDGGGTYLRPGKIQVEQKTWEQEFVGSRQESRC
jgi:hypothetical protein